MPIAQNLYCQTMESFVTFKIKTWMWNTGSLNNI